MRLFALILCLVPLTGTAETFIVTSKVTDVTLYPNSAKITSKLAFSIPAGTHHIVVNSLPAQESIIGLQAKATGVTVGPIVFRESFIPENRQSGFGEIQIATDHIKSIKQKIEAVQNAARRARLAARAADTRIGFLDQLGANEGTAMLDLDAVRALSQLIGTEALDARQIALEAEIAAQNIEHALVDLNEKLEDAQKSLGILQPNDTDLMYVRIEVHSETATDGVLSLIYSATDSTEWSPIYDIYLDRENPDHVDIQRDAIVTQFTGENWTNVNLTLSTLEPNGQTAPSNVYSKRRRLTAPPPKRQSDDQSMGSLAEPMVEASVIIEETGSAFSLDASGLGITYTIATPVSIASSVEYARIPLGALRVPAQLSALAIPERDETAYLMANVTNDTGEDILASGYASFYVDGALAGSDRLPRITSGDTTEIAFGPINGLQLKTIRLVDGEGEGGIISRYNERRSHVRYEVKNLTDETWDVRMLSAVPYSTHDDLQIDWSTSRAPDEVDVDDKIGVLGWDLTLAPGTVQSVEMETSLTWPRDKILR